MLYLEKTIYNHIVKGFHPYSSHEPESYKSQRAYYNGSYVEGVWVVGFPVIVNGKVAINGFLEKEFNGLYKNVVFDAFKNGKAPLTNYEPIILSIGEQTLSKCSSITDKDYILIFENDYVISTFSKANNDDLKRDLTEHEKVGYGRVGCVHGFYLARLDKYASYKKPLVVSVNVYPELNLEYTVKGTVFDTENIYKLFKE